MLQNSTLILDSDRYCVVLENRVLGQRRQSDIKPNKQTEKNY